VTCAATGDAPYDQRTRVTETPRRCAPGVCWSDARSVGRASTARCVVRERAVGTLERRPKCAPHAVCAMRRGVVGHRRDVRRIPPPWNRCQTQPSLGVNHLWCVRPDSCRRPSRKCRSSELGAGAVKVRRPRVSGVGAKRRTLHGAEHSSRLERVMAGCALRRNPHDSAHKILASRTSTCATPCTIRIARKPRALQIPVQHRRGFMRGTRLSRAEPHPCVTRRARRSARGAPAVRPSLCPSDGTTHS
jgi:hypothetical protein